MQWLGSNGSRETVGRQKRGLVESEFLRESKKSRCKATFFFWVSLQFHRNPNFVVPIFLAEIVVGPEVQDFDCKIIFLLVCRGRKPRVENQLK